VVGRRSVNKYFAQFQLSFSGKESEDHAIDFYDVTRALAGFQRSLALTTHLVLNDEVITQAPALKGARIYTEPSKEGSWEIIAGIFFSGSALYKLGTAPNNTPIGHLVFSAYNFIISHSLGFNVDYNKSLGQLYKEHRQSSEDADNDNKLPIIREAQLDSVAEKCSNSIIEIHRPIYKNKTATKAKITAIFDNVHTPLSSSFTFDTYQYMIENVVEEIPHLIKGVISSYNSNTYKGRIYVPGEQRPIPFELSDNIRSEKNIQLIVDSLRTNALREYEIEKVWTFCTVKNVTSKSGNLKKYKVLAVANNEREIQSHT
jgi:hypothetical protein